MNSGKSSELWLWLVCGARPGHLAIYHTGEIPGFVSEIARYVDDHLTIIVLSNRQDGDPSAIRRILAAKMLGE